MKLYLRDPRLLLFSVLIAGASVISGHGAWVFFGYLVAPWLSWVFILVVALGIIGLDVAGTVERGFWRQLPYFAGMFFFIILETLANYFAGQAGFVPQVITSLARAAPDSDLLRIALGDPTTTRWLVVLFLSPASLAVALFTFIATRRVIQLREQSTKRPRRPRQLRALVRRLVAQVRTLREEIADGQMELSSGRADLAAVHEEVAALRAQATETQASAADMRGQLATARKEAADARAEATALRGQLATAQATATDLRAQLANTPPPPVPSRAQVVAYVLAAHKAGRPLAEVARELGWSESSLREWMKAAANGATVEVQDG
jgi:hypothetical protein